MATDEVRDVVADQVGRANRLFAEAKMRDRNGAGLLRIEDEVALRVHRCRFADDFDGVAIGADRTVAAQAEKDRVTRMLIGIGLKERIPLETGTADVILNTDSKGTLRLGPCQIFEHCRNHPRREFLRREPVATTDDRRQLPDVVTPGGQVFSHRSDNILVQRFTVGAGLLAAVQHRDQ